MTDRRDLEARLAALEADNTRLAFFRKAGMAGVGLVGGSALLGALAPAAANAAPSKKQDVKILNYALTLEYLEAAFYAQAVSGGALSGRTLDFAKLVASDEATHVKTLKQALGSAAVAEPKFDFQGTTADQAKFQQTALTLENTGVAAYLGQAGKVTPVVDRTFPLSDVPDAIRYLREGCARGKVIITV